MCADDPQRGGRGKTRSFREKGNYSPSVSYNYGQNSGNFQSPQQPHGGPRRRPDRPKPRQGTGGGNGGGFGNVDKLMKQNDIIIRLLKEIRDRLPKAVEDGARNTSRSEHPGRGGRGRKKEDADLSIDDGGEEEEDA